LQGGLSSASYEVEIAKYAIKKDIPLLGICAGFNNLIRAQGGTPVSSKNKIHDQETKKYVHKNRVIGGTLLHSILNQKTVRVNSVHSGLTKEKDVKNLEISAYSDDGYVEAVELPKNKFVLGVQWHPELMVSYDKDMAKILSSFVNACKK